MPSFKSIRRQVLWNLNSRYIYGRYPLLHTLVFITELIMVSFLVSKFNSYYAARPVLTTMVTNAVLGGVADTVAQTLTAVRERAVRKPGGPDPKTDRLAIEIHEIDRRISEEELIPDSKKQGFKSADTLGRLTRFMAYGFIMAPVQHKWFGFLNRIFPLAKGAGTSAAAKRTAFDQLLFAPVGLGAFFTFMTVAEGGGRKEIQKKFQDIYIPSLKANYLVWP
ncbi:hypothetical protein KCU64_g21291, partial [Aureobasidium melanogenum]